MTDKIIDLQAVVDELFAKVHERMPELSPEMIEILKELTRLALIHGFKIALRSSQRFNELLLKSFEEQGGNRDDKGTGK